MLQQYSYRQDAAAPQRLQSHHGPSANTDKDLARISDRTERRRIQNRDSQRKYRKNLKLRLEDLERRAGSSETPPQSHTELSNMNPRPSPSSRCTTKLSPRATFQNPHQNSPLTSTYAPDDTFVYAPYALTPYTTPAQQQPQTYTTTLTPHPHSGNPIIIRMHRDLDMSYAAMAGLDI